MSRHPLGGVLPGYERPDPFRPLSRWVHAAFVFAGFAGPVLAFLLGG